METMPPFKVLEWGPLCLSQRCCLCSGGLSLPDTQANIRKPDAGIPCNSVFLSFFLLFPFKLNSVKSLPTSHNHSLGAYWLYLGLRSKRRAWQLTACALDSRWTCLESQVVTRSWSATWPVSISSPVNWWWHHLRTSKDREGSHEVLCASSGPSVHTGFQRCDFYRWPQRMETCFW